MCTAISFQTGSHYFGRNLDLEYSYHETVTITPRWYPFSFRRMHEIEEHYAMIGMAYVQDGYPLYYDATNEKGLSMAGLSFWEYADYKDEQIGMDNITPYEMIPWILGQCRNVEEAEMLLGRMNPVAIDFSEALPLSPLHWMISDRKRTIVVESVREGLKVYDNPIGVLTNNPPFEYQMLHLNDYMNITNQPPQNRFAKKLHLQPYSRGMGGIGLPGDYSSASRFVRAAFVKENSICGEGEKESVSQFFHILDSVAHPRGCVDMGDGKYEITVYSSCCNTVRGIYYYKTYENSQVTSVDMRCEDLDGKRLISYELVREQQFAPCIQKKIGL